MEITFILVEPAREENVGAAARAMKTMGFSKMSLVNPCDHLSPRARALAHASEDILENALVFSSFHQAIAEFDLIIASSAKKRNLNKDFLFIPELPELLKSKEQIAQKAAIVFGREESGLKNGELEACHLITSIPMRRKYPSLNLSQAIMVYAQHLSSLSFENKLPKKHKASGAQLNHLMNSLAELLSDVGIPPSKKHHQKILERIIQLQKEDLVLVQHFLSYYKKSKLQKD